MQAKRLRGPARLGCNLARVLCAVCFICASRGAAAEPRYANGLEFSDEQGGFRILSLSGSGRRADPFVLVEEITGDAPVVLTIRGMSTTEGVIDNLSSFTGFSLVKVVINSTGRSWSGFDHELREAMDQPSGYMDGLSFDQPQVGPRPFVSDRFQAALEIREPHDTLRYRDGAVAPGQRVRFTLFITDPTPRREFFLIQRPFWPIAWMAPGTP